MKALIYHNPRCSKSRATLALLTERSIDLQVVQYLDTPPSRSELQSILKQLDKSAHQIIRFSEAEAKQQGLSAQDQRSEDEWLDILLATPKLLERPIVVINDKAAIGRPPENVLALL